jgi:hypothetical protein
MMMTKVVHALGVTVLVVGGAANLSSQTITCDRCIIGNVSVTQFQEVDYNPASSCRGTYRCAGTITKSTWFRVQFPSGSISGPLALAANGFADTCAMCQNGVVGPPYGYSEFWPRFDSATYSTGLFTQDAYDQVEYPYSALCSSSGGSVAYLAYFMACWVPLTKSMLTAAEGRGRLSGAVFAAEASGNTDATGAHRTVGN